MIKSYFSIGLKCLLHILLLPLKIFVEVLFYILYFPSLKFDHTKYNKPNYTQQEIESKLQNILQSFDTFPYLYDGDGAKFLGLAYTSSKDKRIWDSLKQLLYKERTFLREPFSSDYDASAFSGDMWAGMFPAILTAIHEKHLTEEEKIQLSNIIDYTLFKEKTLVFKHPTEKDQDRGFAFPIWSMCSNFFDVISLCYINETITKELKYKILRYIFTFLGFPLMFCLRQGIFVKNVYAMNFFTEHSALVKAYYVYKFINYKFLKFAILKHCKDNPWFMDSGKILSNIANDHHIYFTHLHDYISSDSPELMPDNWKTSYFSLKGFEPKDGWSEFSLPRRFRMRSKYIDDDKPMEPKYKQENIKHADIIHMYNW